MKILNILIIGGTGILSRAIAQEAIVAGHDVTILTNGLGELPESIGIRQHIICDRNQPDEFVAAIKNTQVKSWDLVVDAICYRADQAQSCLDAIHSISQHTIVISTAILYDPDAPMPINESAPLGNSAMLGKYGTEKTAMEQVWLKAWQTESHPVTILRPPHILGEGSFLGVMPFHNRDPFIISRLLNHKPLILADGGKQALQIVFNRDIAKVVLAASGKSQTFGKIYNCANPEIITGAKYFEAIATLLGVPIKIKSIPSEITEQSGWGWSATTLSRILDMSALQRDIGIVPNTPLAIALKETMDYLPKLDHIYDKCDYSLQLDAIEQAVDNGYAEVLKAVLEATSHKERLPIDERMNIEPPNYFLRS
jgi:nucleoside-diphosphate-sugar epimerase